MRRLGAGLEGLAIGCKGRLDVAATGTGNDAGTTDGASAIPFEPVSARVYVAKVKNLMLGLPPPEEEIAAVEQDPAALRGLVDAWFVTARGAGQARQFFQQGLPADADRRQRLLRSGLVANSGHHLPLFAQRKSRCARTALKTIADGKPFTDTVTTHTFMMTPDADVVLPRDRSDRRSTTRARRRSSVPMPDGTISTTQPSGSPTGRASIRASRWCRRSRSTETLDPASPNFMHFAVPARVHLQHAAARRHRSRRGRRQGQRGEGRPCRYNQRKYTSVTSAFLALFGRGPQGYVSDPNDPNGPPTLTIPADVPADKKHALPIQLRRRQ